MIHGHAVWSTDGILAAITLADRVLLVILAVEVELQVVDYLAGLFRQSVLLHERHHSQFHRSQCCGQLQYYASLAILQFLLLVCMTHDREEHTVNTDGCLNDIRSVALVGLRVEVFDALAREFLVLRQVEVGAAMDTLHLLETKRHLEFDVGGSVGIVGQLFVVVETIVLSSESESLVPCHTCLLPFREPVELGARLHEELHLHLLKLAHTEDKLACHDLVAESLTNLCYSERNLHASCLLHVQVVDEDTLCRLRTQIHLHRGISRCAHLGGEHKVELTHVGPVLCSADGVNDFLVQDNLLQSLKVGTLHSLGITGMESIALVLGLLHSLTRFHILFLVEGIAKTFACLGNLLLDFLVILGNLVFDEHVGAIALLRVAVVNQRVVECIHMSTCLPDGGVHEDSRVDAHDVLVQ